MKKVIITILFITFYFLPVNLKAEVKTISEKELVAEDEAVDVDAQKENQE